MVKVVNESKSEHKDIWYIVGTKDYKGNASFLTNKGTYKKVHYTTAEATPTMHMTKSEVLAALEILNSRLPKKAVIDKYLV